MTLDNTAVLDKLRSGEVLVSDGATGTFLQQNGLEPGGDPEEFNMSHPEVVRRMAKEYFDADTFKKLPEILRISRETLKKPHKLIVMLGKSAQDELNKASKGMIYKYKLVPSITESDSKILLVDATK